MKRFLAPFLFAALLGQGLWAIGDKAPTADEFAHHVANGHSYLVTGDFRMNPASPPLPRMLSGLPLLFTRVKAPLDHPSWEALDSPTYAREFFYRSGEDADRLIYLARLPILVLSIFLAWFVFRWAREWFGETAALAALTLYVFSPDILAHSSLATADLAVACFFTMTVRHFANFLEAPGLRRAAYCGVAAGLTLLSKFTGILLFGLLPVLALASGHLKVLSPKRTSVFLLGCFLTVWAGYFFEVKPLLDRTPDPAKKEAVYRAVGGEMLLGIARNQPLPLATFSSALASMIHTRAQGTRAFLRDEWSREGWPHYYFVAFAVKNTIPLLVLFLIGLWAAFSGGLDRKRRAVLMVPILFFFALTLKDRAQAGIRYFLPVYPLVFMFGALAVHKLLSLGPKWMKAAALLFLTLHGISSLRVGPDYLSYFNEIAGGPEGGYRWLRDSNLDWGQDLKPLATQISQRGYDKIVLYYPWPADPDYYKIPHRPFATEELSRPGPYVYAVSVHFLENVAWTRDLKPTFTVGSSIFVYDQRPS